MERNPALARVSPGWVRGVARILVIVSRRQGDLAADGLGDRGRAYRVLVWESRLMVELSVPVR